jgi:hypothetical protein
MDDERRRKVRSTTFPCDNSDVERSLRLTDEPRGDVYRRLVGHAASQSEVTLLVVRPDLGLGEEGRLLLGSLAAFLENEQMTSEWTGTRLLDEQARVLRYSLHPSVVGALQAATRRLYAWRQPLLPEDLCFLRAEDEPWLVSISHEEDAYLELTQWEYQGLLHAVPEARYLLRRQGTVETSAPQR